MHDSTGGTFRFRTDFNKIYWSSGDRTVEFQKKLKKSGYRTATCNLGILFINAISEQYLKIDLILSVAKEYNKKI